MRCKWAIGQENKEKRFLFCHSQYLFFKYCCFHIKLCGTLNENSTTTRKKLTKLLFISMKLFHCFFFVFSFRILLCAFLRQFGFSSYFSHSSSLHWVSSSFFLSFFLYSFLDVNICRMSRHIRTRTTTI